MSDPTQKKLEVKSVGYKIGIAESERSLSNFGQAGVPASNSVIGRSIIGFRQSRRGAIGIEIELALLDPVLHVAAGAVDLLVEVFGLALGTLQRGDNEARIGVAFGKLGLGDDPALGSSCDASST
jgi:hypothetical protein